MNKELYSRMKLMLKSQLINYTSQRTVKKKRNTTSLGKKKATRHIQEALVRFQAHPLLSNLPGKGGEEEEEAPARKLE